MLYQCDVQMWSVRLCRSHSSEEKLYMYILVVCGPARVVLWMAGFVSK